MRGGILGVRKRSQKGISSRRRIKTWTTRLLPFGFANLRKEYPAEEGLRRIFVDEVDRGRDTSERNIQQKKD